MWNSIWEVSKGGGEGREKEKREGEGEGGGKGKEGKREKQKEEEGEQMMARKWSKEAGRDKLKLSHNLSGPIPGNRILLHLGSVPGQG